MCGLSGFIGNKPVDPLAIKLLLIENESRGKHSAGVFIMKGDGSKCAYKGAISPTKLCHDPKLDGYLGGSMVVLGHGRYATGNVIDHATSHPLKVSVGDDYIFGTHNGFMPEYRYQIRKLGLEERDVDSYSVFEYLLKNSHDVRSLSKIEMAAALAWYHDNKVYLYRRESRPLWIGHRKEGMYYSSLVSGLLLIDCSNIQELESDFVYEYTTDGKLLNILKIDKPILKIDMDAGISRWRDNLDKNSREALGLPEPIRTTSLQTTTHSTTSHTNYRNDNDKVFDLRSSMLSVHAILANIKDDVSEGWLSAKCNHNRIVNANDRVFDHKRAYLVVETGISSTKEDALLIWESGEANNKYVASSMGYAVVPIHFKSDELNTTKLVRLIMCQIKGDGDPIFFAYTDFVSIKAGEIVEVSLQEPFREEVKRKREEVQNASKGNVVVGNSKQNTKSVSSTNGGSQGEINFLRSLELEDEGVYSSQRSEREAGNRQEDSFSAGEHKVSISIIDFFGLISLPDYALISDDYAFLYNAKDGSEVAMISLSSFLKYYAEYEIIRSDDEEMCEVIEPVNYIYLRYYGTDISEIMKYVGANIKVFTVNEDYDQYAERALQICSIDIGLVRETSLSSYPDNIKEK